MVKMNDPGAKRQVVIVDYNPRWPALYEEEKARILAVIGQWVAQIEHMGSTSVPGLGAKPIIDIMVGVRILADADQYCIRPLETLGYEYFQAFEADMPERRYFRKNDTSGSRTHQIHMVEVDGEFWQRHLAFRDYLRAHPDEARAYEDLKRTLAPQFTDVNEYAMAKTEFIKAAEARAWTWKAQQK